MEHYVLNEAGEPVLEPDLSTWARWFELDSNRRVALTEVSAELSVSTIFLGLDHSFGRGGGPVLWETMVFRGGHGDDQWRWRSRKAALDGHAAVVAWLEGKGARPE